MGHYHVRFCSRAAGVTPPPRLTSASRRCRLKENGAERSSSWSQAPGDRVNVNPGASTVETNTIATLHVSAHSIYTQSERLLRAFAGSSQQPGSMALKNPSLSVLTVLEFQNEKSGKISMNSMNSMPIHRSNASSRHQLELETSNASR
jgi:hypothetical protein